MVFLISMLFTVPFANAQGVTLPENTTSIFTEVFSKYTKIIAPNRKPIHFLIQDAWSNDKILKARNIMEHFLTD